MNNQSHEGSIHFQILAAGTIIFLAVFSWSARPSDASMSEAILLGLWSIAIYLSFVVLVASHGLFNNGNRVDEQESHLEQSGGTSGGEAEP